MILHVIVAKICWNVIVLSTNQTGLSAKFNYGLMVVSEIFMVRFNWIVTENCIVWHSYQNLLRFIGIVPKNQLSLLPNLNRIYHHSYQKLPSGFNGIVNETACYSYQN